MRIICLANSFKEGGRCLAGIQVDENNLPVLENNRPKWIRPICNTEHGQVPNHLCQHISIRDIVEFDNAVVNGDGYQSENTTFNERSLNVIGTYQNNLNNLCDNEHKPIIFGNRGAAVPQDTIDRINYSLMLIRLDEFEINEREYEDREYPQVRMVFRYNGNRYDLPITDPTFLHRYGNNPEILEEIDNIYLSLSLGVEWQEWYYKLVAAVIT